VDSSPGGTTFTLRLPGSLVAGLPTGPRPHP